MIFSRGGRQIKGLKSWSLDEHFILCRRVLILGEEDWEKISEGIIGHDANSCKKEWEKIRIKNSLNNFYGTSLTTMKFWTPNEVSKLYDSIHNYTSFNKTLNIIPKNDNILWDKISSKVGRSSIQCYLKWKRSFNPIIIKGSWTSSEKEILEIAHKKYGNHWKKISELVPGRTPSQIEIYFRENRRNFLKNNLRYSPDIIDAIDRILSTGLYHMKNGKISWTKLSKDHFPNIKPIQLRKAWIRHNIIGFRKNKWTPEETEKLINAVSKVHTSNISYQIWKTVANFVPGRTPDSCKAKYRYIKFQKKISTPYKPWNISEHLKLIDSAQTHQFRWVDVAIDLLRPETLCRAKFHHLLTERGTISGYLAREAWSKRKL
ncbi:hypothetical protein PCANB_002593 [Pneumocystis canis]|nr:hypothetical protein PCANB_002593 [Pneumocystis canis]